MSVLLSKPLGELVTVSGALFVFLNWVFTNIIVDKAKGEIENYKKAEERAELGNGSDELSTNLSSIVVQLSNLARQLGTSIELARRAADDTPEEQVRRRVDRMHQSIGGTAASSVQIDDFHRLGLRAAAQAKVFEPDRAIVREIRENSDAFRRLKMERDHILAEMWNAWGEGQSSGDIRRAEGRVRELDGQYKALLNRLGVTGREAVDIVNRFMAEFDADLRALKDRIARRKAISIAMYVVGTFLTLYGTVVAKTLIVGPSLWTEASRLLPAEPCE